MKEYPSIPRATGQFFQELPHAHIFDKLDGSSMRSQWSRKHGWYKHGKRHGLIDDSNPHLVQVPALFETNFAEPLAKLAKDSKWQELIVYYEFWGEQSIAGLHYEGDPKKLTLFDAVPDKKGFMSPPEFRKTFEDVVQCATFLGIHNFTRGFVERVRTGEFEGYTFEGVVAKAGERHKLLRGKAKSQRWGDRVKEVYGESAQKVLDS